MPADWSRGEQPYRTPEEIHAKIVEIVSQNKFRDHQDYCEKSWTIWNDLDNIMTYIDYEQGPVQDLDHAILLLGRMIDNLIREMLSESSRKSGGQEEHYWVSVPAFELVMLLNLLEKKREKEGYVEPEEES